MGVLANTTTPAITQPQRPSRAVTAFLILSNLVALLCLYLALRHVKLAELEQDLALMHWGWVAVAVLADIAVYLIHGWRWKLLQMPLENVGYWKYVRAIYVGLFANELLPMRTGEVIRSFLIARWSSIPFSVVLSFFAVERVFDGIWLLLCLVAAVSMFPMTAGLRAGGYALGTVITVAIIVLGALVFLRERVHPYLERHKWLHKVMVIVDDLAVAGRSRTTLWSFLVSAGYLLMQVMPIWAMAQGYRGMEDLTLAQAFFMMVVLRLSSAVPQAPGNLGIFQLLCAQTLVAMNFDAGVAARFAFVLWSAITIPLILAGFVALAVTGARFSELRRQAQEQMARTGPR